MVHDHDDKMQISDDNNDLISNENISKLQGKPIINIASIDNNNK